jgi:hypothetical protein
MMMLIKSVRILVWLQLLPDTAGSVSAINMRTGFSLSPEAECGKFIGMSKVPNVNYAKSL